MRFSVDTKALRKIMIDQGVYTASELSKRSGIHRNTLSGILSGKHCPSEKTAKKLIESLNIKKKTVNDIFRFTF